MKLHGIWASICILAALAAGIGVYGWQQRKVGAQNALAKQAAAKLDTAIALQLAKDARRARDSATAADSLGKLTARTAVVAARAGALSRRADSLEALDSLKPAIQVLRAVISADSVIISQQAQALALVSGQKLASDSSRDAWKAIALEAQKQNKLNLKHGAPRFGCFVGAGLSIGLGHGTGATVGCGIRI